MWLDDSWAAQLQSCIGLTEFFKCPFPHALAGFGQMLVSGQSLEKHGATWLVELKNAVEGKK